MKKVLLVVIAGFFGGSFSARGDIAKAKNLSHEQKQQIAAAIKVLSYSKAIAKNQNQCVQFDPDLLKVLQSEGHLQQDWSSPSIVCADGKQH